MHWFKIHRGFTTNRKFSLVADQLDVPRAEIIALALDLLDYASRQSERGSIVGYDIEEAAHTLDLHKDIISNALLALRNRRFISESEIVNWQEYQSPIDHTNAERQHRFRNKKKQELNEASDEGNALLPLRNALCNTDKIRIDIKKTKAKKDFFELPAWVPEKEWNEWVACRSKKSNTPTALQKSLEVLEKLVGEGYAACDVLNKSIAGGYQGLFPPSSKPQPKPQQAGTHSPEAALQTYNWYKKMINNNDYGIFTKERMEKYVKNYEAKHTGGNC